jgi:hypothetical protein
MLTAKLRPRFGFLAPLHRVLSVLFIKPIIRRLLVAMDAAMLPEVSRILVIMVFTVLLTNRSFWQRRRNRALDTTNSASEPLQPF